MKAIEMTGRSSRVILLFLLMVCFCSVVARVPQAYGADVQYELSDMEGNEIGFEYIGIAEVLQQGVHFRFQIWDTGDDPEYEERAQELITTGRIGPYYEIYYFHVEITCLEDNQRMARVHTAIGPRYFFEDTNYSGWIGSADGWADCLIPTEGMFLGGRTYRIDIQIGRDISPIKGASLDNVKWEEERSFTMGTSCSHSNVEYVNEYEATCTEDGYTGDLVCMDCGEVVEVGQVIPALGHDEQWQVVREATEDEPGLEQLICMRDGEVLQEREIPRLAPSEEAGESVDPSTEVPVLGGAVDEVDLPNDDAGSTDGGSDEADLPNDDAGSTGGGSGSDADDHDQKADAGMGNEGAADTQDGSAQAAAPSAEGAAPSADSQSDQRQSTTASGESAVSASKNQSAQTQTASGAAAVAAPDGGGEQEASVGAESEASRVGVRTEDDASVGSASSDDLPSNKVAGNVYRVLGGAAANGESDEESDAAEDEDESQAAALDIQVVGFPILWVLMWASLPAAFALGLARRYGRNAIGVRRPSRLALFERHASSEQMRHRYQVSASHRGCS